MHFPPSSLKHTNKLSQQSLKTILRYPANPKIEGLILEEIGNSLGFSKSRAKQIHESAIAKLREVIQTDSTYRCLINEVA